MEEEDTPHERRPFSEDEVLLGLGLLMVIGILLGLAWIFFDPVVDVFLTVAFGTVGLLVWRGRRRQRN